MESILGQRCIFRQENLCALPTQYKPLPRSNGFVFLFVGFILCSDFCDQYERKQLAWLYDVIPSVIKYETKEHSR